MARVRPQESVTGAERGADRPLLSRRRLLGGALLGAPLMSLAAGGCAADPVTGTGARPVEPSVPPAPPAPRFAGDPGPGKLLLGVSLDIAELASDRGDLGRRGITLSRRFYRSHQVDLMSRMVLADASSRVLPFVSFKTPKPWRDVAEGRSDRWLESILASLGGLRCPAMLSLHHEPENDHSWAGNTPESWLAMQRHAIRMAAPFPTVTVVPVLMQWTFDPASGRDPRRWLLPESPVLGVDVYNKFRGDGSGMWVEFDALVRQIRQVVPDTPLVIPEFGSVVDQRDPTRSPKWLRAAYDSALKNNVAALAWFDSEYNNKIGDIQLGPEGAAAMRELLRRPETVRWDEFQA